MQEDLETAERVQLFHGTTKSAADRVRDEGWRPIDPVELVRVTAAGHDETRERVWADLERWSSHVTHPGRTGWVSFAPTHEKAARWAQRAPEAKWEALWAIWRIRNPELAEAWTTNGDGEIWVFQQMLDDPPTVISVEIPVTELHDGGFNSWAEEPLSDEQLDILPHLPDIRARCPAPPEWISAVDVVPRRVYTPLAADLLRLDFETFVQRAKAGEFGPSCLEEDDTSGRWWPWDSFRSFVPTRD